jgi:hypothetical protein
MSDKLKQGVKYDDGKAPMWFLDGAALAGVAMVMGKGALKYAAHNWRKGMAWSRLYSAALRHIFKHLDGEDIDQETGESHLDCAIANLMMLSAYEKRRLGVDDRWFHELKREGRQGPAEELCKPITNALESLAARAEAPPKRAKKARKKHNFLTQDDVLTALLIPRSIPELAKDLGISKATAANWIRRIGKSGVKLNEAKFNVKGVPGHTHIVRYTYA